MADKIPCLPNLEFDFDFSINLPPFPPKIPTLKVKCVIELPCPLELAGGAPVITFKVAVG